MALAIAVSVTGMLATYFVIVAMSKASLCLAVIVTHLAVLAETAIAQIIPDGTLSTRVTQSGQVLTIDDGTRSGNNLFHSFGQFSVPTGGTAFFNNAIDVQNIFSRITGGTVSNIDGLIQANGTANLFLLNPNGILFGPNAALNIGGSFIGTTANSIKFADGVEFSATNANGSPLLTISVPIGLQMGQNPGAIQVQGPGSSLAYPSGTSIFAPAPLLGAGQSATGLRVSPGATLALVGGEIDLTGGSLTAPQGRIELGSNTGGVVSLNPLGQGWSLGYSGVSSFQDIHLSQKALVDASGFGGGSIQIQGNHITLADGSLVLNQNQGLATAGPIAINAASSLELTGTSSDGTIASAVRSETVGLGNAAAIAISTERLVVQNGSGIKSQSFSPGAAGDIAVNASESLQVAGLSPFGNNDVSVISTLTYQSGQAGNIQLSSGKMRLADGGAVS